MSYRIFFILSTAFFMCTTHHAANAQDAFDYWPGVDYDPSIPAM